MSLRNIDGALDSFFEVLGDNDLPNGLEHRLRLLGALEIWGGRFQPHRLRTLLCPMFATTADEQRLFYELFDRYFPHLAIPVPVPGAVDSPKPAGATHPAHTLSSKWRPIRTILLGFVLTATTIILVTTWRSNEPKLPPTSGQVESQLNTAVPPVTIQPSMKIRWSVAALFVPLLLLALMEGWAWRNRRIILSRATGEESDTSAGLPTSLDVRAQAKAGFPSVLRRLRQPTAGPLRLHLGHTIAATVRAGGFPEFCYEPVFRRPEYFVLIDRASARDHQAMFFEELVSALDRHGLRIVSYSFRGDPRICESVKSGQSFYLSDLFYQASDQRLLIFGDGDRFVSESFDLSTGGSLLLRWRERTILTPLQPNQWGHREFQLARHFLLLPATSESLAAAVDYFDPERSAYFRRPASRFDYRHPDLDRASPDEIRQLLGDNDLYDWLCACALYPQLQWDITLQLGNKLNRSLLTEQNLARLIRLPWFRRGSIPLALQQGLAESLGDARRLHLRTVILDLLAGAGSDSSALASDSHKLEIAVQRLDIMPNDRRRVLEDETLARVVSRYSIPALGLVLPPGLRRILFPFGVPTLGLRPRVRFGLMLSGVLAIMVGAVQYHQNLAWQFYFAKSQLDRYYANLRFVYEVESKMRELRRENAIKQGSGSAASALPESQAQKLQSVPVTQPSSSVRLGAIGKPMTESSSRHLQTEGPSNSGEVKNEAAGTQAGPKLPNLPDSSQPNLLPPAATRTEKTPFEKPLSSSLSGTQPQEQPTPQSQSNSQTTTTSLVPSPSKDSQTPNGQTPQSQSNSQTTTAGLPTSASQGSQTPNAQSDRMMMYRLLADGGNSDAMNELGDLYLGGLGVPQDYSQAKDWYQKAAARENTGAMTRLGDMYLKGLGVSRDYSQAKAWYLKAAVRGDPRAKAMLEQMGPQQK